MLYILTGSDVTKAKARAKKLALGHEVVRFGEGAEPFANITGFLSAQGLFASKVALVVDRPLEDNEGKEILRGRAKEFVDSGTLVIVIEPALDAPTKKRLPKAAVIEEFETKKKEVAPPQSVFALTDAFLAGDRKKTWILYRRLIEDGASPEEIHGALAWQARALVLAGKTKSATESGLKPFVYSKAQRAGVHLKEGEAETFSRELMHLVHRSRLGGGDLEDMLEAFLLKKPT